MGVRGLTTYINSNSSTFFLEFKLHDCILVIDGNSLAAILYSANLGPYSAFGGDYDVFADHVENFIKKLRQCKVEPVFIFDGGYEVKKATTVRKRNVKKVFAIEKVTPDKPAREFYPCMLRPVLQERLIDLDVLCLQSDYEADREIAAVAKYFNAPVLSNDSDFFIFDVPFIPLSRFSFDVCHCSSNSNNAYHYMACEIFYVENFLKIFGGLKKDMLPLLATVLGNDYVSRSLFKNFYSLIKLDTSKKLSLGQRRIGGFVKWLRKETFDSALTKILASLPKNRRQEIKNGIKSIVNGYSKLSTCLENYLPELKDRKQSNVIGVCCELKNLRLSNSDCFNETNNNDRKENYVNKKEQCLGFVENSPAEGDEVEVINSDEEEVDIEAEDEVFFSSASSLTEIPDWFLEKSRKCQMPPQIITLLTLNSYFCVPQIEDCTLPHAGEIGVPILKVISGMVLNTNIISYWHRLGSNTYKPKTVEIDQVSNVNLFTLNKLPMEKRRNILMHTLCIENEYILDSYPEDWQLLLICLAYWMKNGNTVNLFHIHAVITMAIIINTFQTKIGIFRKISLFKKKYGAKLISLEKIRESLAAKVIYDKKKTFLDELVKVTEDDCLVTFETFFPYFGIDLTLKERPRTFQRSIVHCFAELQTILDLSQMLNFLLQCPFPRVKISKFYSGTFLYNMAVNFKRQPDLFKYLEKLYKKAPSLLNLHMVLYNELIQFTNFSSHIINIPSSVNDKKRRRRRKKVIYDTPDEDQNFSEVTDAEHFFDGNNKFSLLQEAKKF